SEVSDALAIVVSEETGVISLVGDGDIRRNLNKSSLRDILNREMNSEEIDPASWFRRWTGDGRDLKKE
ncbi:MAG: TIGR00159 family protein, partial [Deltaproteobacteria bacterium]